MIIMFVFKTAKMSGKIGHDLSKSSMVTWLIHRNTQGPCTHSIDHITRLVLMKHIYIIWEQFENVSHGSKKEVTDPDL